MTNRVIVQIPFAGLYNSIWEQELDSVHEREAEYFADERQAEDCVPEALRLDESTVNDLLHRAADWSVAHLAIARAYTESFADAFDHKVFPDLALEFEGMRSPREYNFTTDRLFAWADVDALRALLESIDHKAMDAVARERHTSRSGFISSYDADWTSWGDVESWDHNQYETLIRAACRAVGDDVEDWDYQLYERLYEAVYSAWQGCIDWAKFEELCTEAREEIEAALRADDPDYVPLPARCAFTVEMFPNSPH